MLRLTPETIPFWRGLLGASFVDRTLLATQGRTVFGDIALNGWLGSGSLPRSPHWGWSRSFRRAAHQSLANVAVINAAGPFVAAGLAWLCSGETVRVGTLAASLGGTRRRRDHCRQCGSGLLILVVSGIWPA